jgi:hypothetical protein
MEEIPDATAHDANAFLGPLGPGQL